MDSVWKHNSSTCGGSRKRRVSLAVIAFLLVAVIITVPTYVATQPETVQVVETDAEETLPSLIKVATIGTGAILIEYTELLDDNSKVFYYLTTQDLDVTTLQGVTQPHNLALYLTHSSTPTLDDMPIPQPAARLRRRLSPFENALRIGLINSIDYPYRLPESFLPGNFRGVILVEENPAKMVELIEISSTSFDVVVDPERNIGSDGVAVPTTSLPTQSPSRSTELPTTATQSKNPSSSPTSATSRGPTQSATSSPSNSPTPKPSTAPTFEPTSESTAKPTSGPSLNPTTMPTFSSHPTTRDFTPSPTNAPSFDPTARPTATLSTAPSTLPSTLPSANPSTPPSFLPTGMPSIAATDLRTTSPSSSPTAAPSRKPSTPPSTAPVPDSSELPLILRSELSGSYNIDGTITIDYVQGFQNGQVVDLPRLQFDIPDLADAPGPYLYLSKRPYSETRDGDLEDQDVFIPIDSGSDGQFNVKGEFEQFLDEIENVQELEDYANGSWIVWCRPFGVWIGGGEISAS